jgi:hypothetical protein
MHFPKILRLVIVLLKNDTRQDCAGTSAGFQALIDRELTCKALRLIDFHNAGGFHCSRPANPWLLQ